MWSYAEGAHWTFFPFQVDLSLAFIVPSEGDHFGRSAPFVDLSRCAKPR